MGRLNDLPLIEARLKGAKQRPSLIVLTSSFTTAREGAAYAHVMTMHTPSAGESNHFVVDESKAFRGLPDNRQACLYAMDDTRKMLTIRICDNPSESPARWDGRMHSLMLARTADLVAQLCLSHRIPPRFLDDESFRKWSKWRVKFRGGLVTRGQMTLGYFPEEYFLTLVRANMEKHKLMNN